ncbi:two-component system regulatory protein YycI [Lentibacillus sp. Marseille-P4043]|uniref:two-component system regulatory protein YycI n=1 Tax=Lentibacillus sp. Marseille-P4043 TaxID=2040293 RepID=UPI000D0B9F9C|nr:two-component system regulatory protein YycI [Lentibacillus sp. Marseille-P4043]
MQWSQIKTLFILCFLVLDVYLLIQFLDKQEKNDLDVMEQQESTIEQQLKLEDIKIPKKLPDGELEESYISVKQKAFTGKEMGELAKFDNQNAALVTDNLIVSHFKEPVPITDSDEAKEIINSNILFPDDYEYWDWNKELNVLIFFQEKNDQPIYFNQSGLLLVFLNDENEITFYTQTMLGEEVEDFDTSKKQLIKPIRAIDTLYNQNELHTGEEVTDAKIGFYTALPMTSGEQTFVPTWKISVNGERNYFINAIENFAFSSDDLTFLNESITAIKSEIAKMKDKKEFKNALIDQLTKKLDGINRSEVE